MSFKQVAGAFAFAAFAATSEYVILTLIGWK